VGASKELVGVGSSKELVELAVETGTGVVVGAAATVAVTVGGEVSIEDESELDAAAVDAAVEDVGVDVVVG
jgi:hypothetical protein